MKNDEEEETITSFNDQPLCYGPAGRPMDAPKSLYVHVPFCDRICPYCAFTVTDERGPSSMERFLAGIDRELATVAPAGTAALDTIYVGGGTPTALDEPRLSRLLRSLAAKARGGRVLEWTVEANPGTVDDRKAAAMTAAGVTRLSLGAQSMDDRLLRRLGRTHAAVDVRTAVAVARRAGFADLNVDLIYGQPGQTLERWLCDVDAVIDLAPTHVSLYELTFEPGTPFGLGRARGTIPRAPESLVLDMFHGARVRLAEAGLAWYEVSNFAAPGRESLHNQVYWRNEPYFGIGPGAFACTGLVRTTNAAALDAWATLVETTGQGVAERDLLSARDTFVECLAAGLRTRAGVDLDVLQARTGFDLLDTHLRQVDDLVARALAELDGRRLRLTLEGVLILDAILPVFLDLPVPAHAR
jgi:oxygen-independent coproporphyrinogen-3 oxidase